MTKALSASSIPPNILPGMEKALAFMGGMAVVGGIGGAALVVSQAQAGRISPRRGWLYSGIGTGVLVGGAIGYFGGRFIIARTIAKAQEAAEAAAKKEQEA